MFWECILLSNTKLTAIFSSDDGCVPSIELESICDQVISLCVQLAMVNKQSTRLPSMHEGHVLRCQKLGLRKCNWHLWKVVESSSWRVETRDVGVDVHTIDS